MIIRPIALAMVLVIAGCDSKSSESKPGSSTPIANSFMAAQFPQFDGHLWINQEFQNIDPSVGPDTALMFQILKKYAVGVGGVADATINTGS